uniref:Uncharacterized protein n=1 Tax=Timema tahoe TaxID=61484 RepID=A0A7R9ICN4_9NEOP|nr:unnamed protein product [Timema tahoe]
MTKIIFRQSIPAFAWGVEDQLGKTTLSTSGWDLNPDLVIVGPVYSESVTLDHALKVWVILYINASLCCLTLTVSSCRPVAPHCSSLEKRAALSSGLSHEFMSPAVWSNSLMLPSSSTYRRSIITYKSDSFDPWAPEAGYASIDISTEEKRILDSQPPTCIHFGTPASTVLTYEHDCQPCNARRTKISSFSYRRRAVQGTACGAIM